MWEPRGLGWYRQDTVLSLRRRSEFKGQPSGRLGHPVMLAFDLGRSPEKPVFETVIQHLQIRTTPGS